MVLTGWPAGAEGFGWGLGITLRYGPNYIEPQTISSKSGCQVEQQNFILGDVLIVFDNIFPVGVGFFRLSDA